LRRIRFVRAPSHVPAPQPFAFVRYSYLYSNRECGFETVLPNFILGTVYDTDSTGQAASNVRSTGLSTNKMRTFQPQDSKP
jgi:hypothetical protein